MTSVLDQPPEQTRFDDAADLLPAFLVRLSNESLNLKLNGLYNPFDQSLAQSPMEIRSDEDLSVSLEISQSETEPIFIRPWSKLSPVVAVDVSSIRVGETSEGILCALRGAAVCRNHKRYVYNRCGPLIFHLTDKTTHSMFRALRFPSGLSESSMPPATRLLGGLRNALERWIQRSICHFFRDSLVLLDGSLTAGTPDNPARPLEAILEAARNNGDIVLAISKSTKLRLNGSDITHLTEQVSTACLIEVDSAVRLYSPILPVQLLGRIFVAKLSKKGFSFRLDVDKEIPRGQAIGAVRKLISSDIVSQGYPETLRLAHILSTFTANEVIGIQRFLSARCGLHAEPPVNLRRFLFGPYGSSWEAS